MRSLSIFVDESGDFGKTDNKNPYYLLTLVLHDQSKPLSLSKLEWLDNRLKGLFSEGSNTYVHAGPIIRKEKRVLQFRIRRQTTYNKFFVSFCNIIRYKLCFFYCG